MVSGLDALKEICYGKQTDDPETTIAPSKGIVQRFDFKALLLAGLSSFICMQVYSGSAAGGTGWDEIEIRHSLLSFDRSQLSVHGGLLSPGLLQTRLEGLRHFSGRPLRQVPLSVLIS